MRVSILLSGFAALAAAVPQNPFSIPPAGLTFTAGQRSTIQWTPTAGDTVTIVLRSGASGQLIAGAPIAERVPNTGEFEWTPPTDITKGTDYAFEIINDQNPSETNFSPYVIVESTNNFPSITAPWSYTAFPSGFPTQSTAGSTATSTTTTGSTTTTSGTSTTTSTTGTTSTTSTTSTTGTSRSGTSSTTSTTTGSTTTNSSSTTSRTSSSTTTTNRATATSSNQNGSAGKHLPGSFAAAAVVVGAAVIW